MGPVDEGPSAGRAVLNLLLASGGKTERMEHHCSGQWWGQSGVLDRAAIIQGLSPHECDGDVRKMWKLPVNSQSGWLHRRGHLNSESTLVEEGDSISGKGGLASRPLLLGDNHRQAMSGRHQGECSLKFRAT